MNLEHKKKFISKDFSKTISYTTLNQLKVIIKLLIVRDSGERIIHLNKNEVRSLFEINGGKSKKLLYYTISNLLKEAQITLFPNKQRTNIGLNDKGRRRRHISKLFREKETG